MAEFYAEEYAKAMQQITGQGQWEQYLYWAYSGLGVDPTLLIDESVWESHQSNWNSFSESLNFECD